MKLILLQNFWFKIMSIPFFWSPKGPENRYASLNAQLILKTLSTLHQRIVERFPQSGLSGVAQELCQVGENLLHQLERLRRPIFAIRLVVVGTIIALVVVALGLFNAISSQLSWKLNGVGDFLQVAESAINELIFLSLSIFFLANLESRFKRRIALESLHRLRSIAHVVDMHQLTKDPAILLAGDNMPATNSSPARSMNGFMLTRYLEYCSEMLALTSKLAALHAQDLNDPVVLAAVNDVESLAHGLSNKIWQKIMIMDLSLPHQEQE